MKHRFDYNIPFKLVVGNLYITQSISMNSTQNVIGFYNWKNIFHIHKWEILNFNVSEYIKDVIDSLERNL